MNVTRLQQPPPQSSSTRSVSEAEDITPDVRCLAYHFVKVLTLPSFQFLSIRLVNKRTRVKLSPEPLDLSSVPNKGQLFVVAGTLGWFVAIVRSSTGLGMLFFRCTSPFLTPFKPSFPRHLRICDLNYPLRTLSLTTPSNLSGQFPSLLSPRITSFSHAMTPGWWSA